MLTLFDQNYSPTHVFVLVNRIARVPEPERGELRADVEGFRPVAEPGRVKLKTEVIRRAPPQAGFGRDEEQGREEQERDELCLCHPGQRLMANVF